MIDKLPSIDLPSKPSLTIIGKVYPEHTKVNFRTDFTLELPEPPLDDPYQGLDAKYRFVIKDSVVEVSCYLNRVISTDMPRIFFAAYEIARAAVDLLAFSLGIGLTLVFERAVYLDGSVLDLQRQYHKLPPLCTAFAIGQGNSVQRTFLELLQNRALLLAFRDLTETLEDPLREAINCARAMEALAQIISPNEKNESKRWGNLRDVLNVTRPYLMSITEHSKGPRHGSYFEASPITNEEAQIRAWTVMNRFLEYRIRGGLPLPLSEFPRL